MDNFLIQTGERKEIIGNSGSGNSGNSGKIIAEKYDAHLEKIDLNKKRLEIIPRIRFNHRCQVAWALPVDDEDILQDPHMLSSLSKQFFITMDEAPFLDTKKYIIFGTIRGDTVFNALRIGKTESLENGELVDKSNPPKIKRIRIEYHPMDDLVATNEQMIPWKKQEEDQTNKADNDVKRRRKKRKGKRDLNVLSFGGEMEEGDGDGDESGGGNLFGGAVGMHSSHDSKHEKKIQKQKKSSTDSSKMKKSKRDQHDESSPTTGTGTSTGQKEESNIAKAGERNFDESSAVVHIDEPSIKETERNSNLEEKISIQHTNTNPDPHPDPKAIENSKPTMSALEMRRMKYMSKKGVKRKASQKRDDETMSKLNQFKSKMFEVKGVKENGKRRGKGKGSGSGSGRSEDNSLASRLSNKLAGETGDGGKSDRNDNRYENGTGTGNGDEDRSWMRSKFKCKRHIDIETKELLSGDRRKIDDYEIIDEKRHTSKKSRRRHH
eukprot:57969_1